MEYDDADGYLMVMQMHADIDTKMADTKYDEGLARYEPWKVVISALTASAAVFGVIGGILGYMLRGSH